MRLLGIFIILIGILPLAEQATAHSVVRIVSDIQQGFGIAIRRGGECRIITPKHVVGDGFAASVTSRDGSQIPLKLIDNVEVVLSLLDNTELREDLALLKPEQGGNDICDNNMARFQDMQNTLVATTDGRGNYKFHDVNIQSASERVLMFQFGKDLGGQMQSISGAPIIRRGVLTGMVVRLSTSRAKDQQVAYAIELIAKEFGDWVRGEILPVTVANESLLVLEHVRNQLPSSDIGQIAALKAISERGGRLAGLDLKGFFFERAYFKDLDLTDSDLSGAALSHSSFGDAVLSGVVFDFAVGQGLKMVGAKLEKSHHQYADYDNSNFTGASLRQANLYFATLRNATLVDVDFTGANLSYVDLSGADVSGARFNNAILYGAIFKGVKGIDKAEFRNTSVTNMVGANQRSFNEQQVCGHYVGAGGFDYMKIIEMSPSPYFSDGYKYEPLDSDSGWNYSPAPIIGMAHYHFLRPCLDPPANEKAVGTKYMYLSSGAGSSLSIGKDRKFYRDFLSKRGLRDYIVTRMKKRNDEVVSALFTRDFIIPDGTQDKEVVAHIHRITDGIRESHVDCMDATSIRHLIRARSAQKPNKNLIYDEIFQQIVHDAKKISKQQILKETYGRAYKVGELLPFGSLHPNISNVKQDYSKTEVNLSLGRDTVTAYTKWSKKRSAYSKYAFCFEQVFSDGLINFESDPEQIGNSIVKTALQNIKVKPNLLTIVDFLSWNYLGLGFYFDRIPPIIAADPQNPRNQVLSQLDVYSQFRTLVDITKVEMLPDVPLVFIYANYLRDQIVRTQSDLNSTSSRRQ